MKIIITMSFIFANGQGYYKYMWWGIQRDEQNYDFMALGNHGQIHLHLPPEEPDHPAFR